MSEYPGYDAGEYRPRVGLDSIYIAEITADELGVYTPEAPQYLAPAAEASQASTVNTETIYADDQAYEVFTIKGETAISLKVTNIPLGLLASLTGQQFDEESGLFYEYGGVAPYFALMFRSLKSNGGYRYYCFPKCKFDVPDEAATTRGETPEPQMLEITVHAIKTTCKFDLGGGTEDGLVRIIGDDDVTEFDSTGWFDAVPVPDVVSESA
jgi:phi13 family phage major tail protein